MTLEPLPLEGAYVVHGFRSADARGWFWKNYRDDEFRELGLDFTCRETFFSWSQQGVLRGLHFQMPPKAHSKLVTCLSGRVLDVLLDLRKHSPQFGKSVAIELAGDGSRSVYVPVGVAHGFVVLSEGALMGYQTSVPHDPAADTGVRWNSFGFEWPCVNPLVSERDASLPPVNEFSSPF